MGAYINGIGCVSPQRSLDSGNFPEEVMEYHARMIQCPEPETDPGIDEKYLRRMSRLIRLGWTAARICLDDAGQVQPDAVITGSGWGSVQDSEKFLLSMYKNKENLLPPTPFIQSTHNALGSQIAILLESYRYNMAYAHAGFAFEHALEDALLRLQEGDSKNVLVGGFDEITPNQFVLYDRLGRWRKAPVSNLHLFEGKEDGTISGEGFCFFMLGDEKNEHTCAEVKYLETALTDELPAPGSRLRSIIRDHKIDWVFAGMNGDQRYDGIYRDVISDLFPGGVNVAAYKHLCGEYLTASAFGMWAAAVAVRRQNVPLVFRVKTTGESCPLKNILIFNILKGTRCSFILLSGTN